MMTRDDMLRELELLPAWKLRAPVAAVLPTEVEISEIEKVDIENLEVTEVVIADIEKPTSVAPRQYEITLSQDKQWAFANETFTSETSIPAGRVDIGLQGMLFNNILYALSIEKPSKMQAESIADIQAKMIVAMGESVAQALLNTQASLESLRGKLHQIGSTQLVVTCDLAHLLNNPLDKAKVWQDLCLARSHLQGLHVQD